MDRVLIEALHNRSRQDLAKLSVPERSLFVTGLPNFRRFFVRDTLWFCLQILSLPQQSAVRNQCLPSVRASLRLIAEHQSTTPDNVGLIEFIEWPPDVWHKMMRNAALGQMPHEIPRSKADWLWLKVHYGIGFLRGHPYYGSIDATPLWLVTLAEYLRQTDDIHLLAELTPNIVRAYAWLGNALRLGDGFLRYGPRRLWNLKHHQHQGWRDGAGSGGLGPLGLRYPIALLDVQCLAYRALTDIHTFREALAVPDEKLDRVQRLAQALRERILNSFWMPSERLFAFALQGNNEQVQTITIEQAFLLWCDVLPHRDSRRIRVRSTLLSEQHLWTDWGIRTTSVSDPHFDAFSYHRGSLWPWLSWLAHEALKDTHARVAERIREATLRGLIHIGKNDELFFVTETGEVQQTRKAASPQLWTVGAALALAEAELH